MERQTVGKGLTVLEKMRLELFYAHQYNYHTLIRERMDIFDDDGTIEITNADGTKYRQSGRKFITNTITYFEKKDQPNERALCGHVDVSSRGVKEWGWDAYNPGGAVQGKAMDSAMAAKMSFVARAGHACGADFMAAETIKWAKVIKASGARID